ncbi:MAG TPA: HNH endonuclease family protein [Frankiaceae bacterium]|nr:HNH endonuclease family protein [Frankiaceae bacterium]
MLLAVAASGLVGAGQRWRKRRRGRGQLGAPGLAGLTLLLVAGVVGVVLLADGAGSTPDATEAIARAPTGSALAALQGVPVKGRAPKTGYSRGKFGEAWADVDHNGCDTRDDVLRRDLTGIQTRSGTRGCVVVAGMLAGPYTGKRIQFSKSAAAKVQIDHVVALSDAWQTGAQGWSDTTRLEFANDPLELLAVDGTANQDKGDGDTATWLPSQKSFRCAYVSRQVAVKLRYHLWVTPAERDAMAGVLQKCPDEQLP